MVRPEKNTVDYIPLDCQFSDSMQAVESLYGNDGFVVWVKLLQKLGRTENYIIDVRDTLHWSLFYPLFRIPENKLIDILNLLSSLDCINKELWKQHIIYSQNFVKRIRRVYRKRNYELKNINTILEEMGVLGAENLVLGAENLVLGAENTQSKVKESKVKESKEDNNIISLNKKKISKNEREILKNYLLNKKRKEPIADIDAYISLLVKNGDVEYQLERALKWQAKQEKKKQEVSSAAAEKIEEKEEKEVTDRAYEEFKQNVKKLKKLDCHANARNDMKG